MRRAKLAPASLPPGALPSTSWYEVPRCFVCDEAIKSHRLSTSLLAGRTQYSHSPLPSKIGEYIGDDFVVVVTAQDALCKHCMGLINTMDRLEQELRQHRSTLTNHLKTKYGLDGKSRKPARKPKVDDEEEDDPVVIELSDEEWTPYKKQRTEQLKHHRCTICKATFSNLSHFMAHLSRHKQFEKPKPMTSTTTICPPNKSMAQVSTTVLSASGVPYGAARLHLEQIAQSMFKCGCCTESFTSKEKLAEHMRMHTANPVKISSSHQPQTVVEMKLLMDTDSTANMSEPNFQASALFQDLEQLPQPEIPMTSSVCTEEQKGKVCLLALLNNGVCSDLSHRAPAENQPAASVVVSMNDSLQALPGMSAEPTISVTVSLPSDIGPLGLGGNPSQCVQIMGQQPSIPPSLSLPKAVQQYHSINAGSMQPVSHPTKAIVVSIPDTPSVQRAALNSSNGLRGSLSSQRLNISKTHSVRRPLIKSETKSIPQILDMPDLLGCNVRNESTHVMRTLNIAQGSSSSVNVCMPNSGTPNETTIQSHSIQDMPSLGGSSNQDMPSLDCGEFSIIDNCSDAASMGSNGSHHIPSIVAQGNSNCSQGMPNLGCSGAEDVAIMTFSSTCPTTNLTSSGTESITKPQGNMLHNMPLLLSDVPTLGSNELSVNTSMESNNCAQNRPELDSGSIKNVSNSKGNNLQDLPDLLGVDVIEPNGGDVSSLQVSQVLSETGTLCASHSSVSSESAVSSLPVSIAGSVRASVVDESATGTNIDHSDDGLNVQVECLTLPPSTNKDSQDPIGNIAIVNVTSVPVNGEGALDAENVTAEWFYSNLDKLETASGKTAESDSVFEQSWLQETKDSSGSGTNKIDQMDGACDTSFFSDGDENVNVESADEDAPSKFVTKIFSCKRNTTCDVDLVKKRGSVSLISETSGKSVDDCYKSIVCSRRFKSRRTRNLYAQSHFVSD